MGARWMQQKFQRMKKSRKKAYLKRPKSGTVNTAKIATYDIYNNRQRVKTNTGVNDNTEPILDNTFTKEVPRSLWGLYHRSKPKLDVKTGKWETKGWDQESLEFVKHVSDCKKLNPFISDHEIWRSWLISPKLAVDERKREEIREESLRDKREFLIGVLYEVWQGKRLQGIKEYHELRLLGDVKEGLVLYFSGNEFVFGMLDQDTWWHSKTYRGNAQAMSAFRNNSISGWKRFPK